MKDEIPIPFGWHKLSKGTLIKEGDEYYSGGFNKYWVKSDNWRNRDNNNGYKNVGANNLIYIRKNKDYTLELKNALWRILRNPNRKSERIKARKILKEYSKNIY